MPIDYDVEKEETKGLISYKKLSGVDFMYKVKKFANFVRMLPDNFKISGKNEKEMYGNDEDENHDWWSKYYASLEVNLLFDYLFIKLFTYWLNCWLN